VGNRRRNDMHPTFYRRRVDPNNLGSQDHSLLKERRNEQVTIGVGAFTTVGGTRLVSSGGPIIRAAPRT
jgi:hypothetical protein